MNQQGLKRERGERGDQVDFWERVDERGGAKRSKRHHSFVEEKGVAVVGGGLGNQLAVLSAGGQAAAAGTRQVNFPCFYVFWQEN